MQLPSTLHLFDEPRNIDSSQGILSPDLGFLMIHGFNSSPVSLDPLAGLLASLGATVYVPILPGHGPNGEGIASVTWKDWVRSVDRYCDELARQCATVIVIGHSMGGLLALILAAKQKADAVVTMACPVYPNRMKMVKTFFDHLLTGDLQGLRDYMSPLLKLPLKGGVEFHKLLNFSRSCLALVSQPLLILQGDNDYLVRADSAAFIHQAVASEIRQMEVLVSAGHHLQREFLTEVSELLLGFARRHLPHAFTDEDAAILVFASGELVQTAT